MILRKVSILAAAVLAVAVAGYALHRAVEAARPTVTANTSAAASSAEPADAGPTVIRFVKDPQAAPAFQVRDLSGKVVSPEEFNGKVILLNFWATWCPPCRLEIPEFIQLQEQYKGKLQIIGVSEDESPATKVEQFVQRVGINYPVVMSTPQIDQAYGGIEALPTSFVIDTHGRVVQKHEGLYPVAVYQREVRALLGMPVNGRVETFEDTGQVFPKNVVKAKELPGVSFAGLTPAQRKEAMARLTTEKCTCGCGMTIAECRMTDPDCPVSKALAAKVVKEVASGGAPTSAPAANTHSLKGD